MFLKQASAQPATLLPPYRVEPPLAPDNDDPLPPGSPVILELKSSSAALGAKALLNSLHSPGGITQLLPSYTAPARSSQSTPEASYALAGGSSNLDLGRMLPLQKQPTNSSESSRSPDRLARVDPPPSPPSTQCTDASQVHQPPNNEL